jgi:hypothetical protein
MQLTQQIVRLFEQDQANYGTTVAISNLLFLVASDILRGTGVTGLTVRRNKAIKKAAKVTRAH